MNENLNNDTGMEFYDLSHPWGFQTPNWPYFEDVKIERMHYHAKSGVLTQKTQQGERNQQGKTPDRATFRR